jgi:SAM-dependent methyltransferase
MTAPTPPLTAAAREARHFDRLVGETGDFNPLTARAWSTLARRFAEAMPGSEPLRVLDVGCGTGHSRRIYESRSRAYFGLDVSLVSLQMARRRFPGGWLRGDAFRLPFADASLDVVAFSSVLHHLPDRPAALREAHRVLRAGGGVFAFDPNVLHPAMALFRHPRSPLYDPRGVSPDEQPLLPSALRRDFAAAGFGAIRQRCQSDLPYRAVSPRGLDALLPLYNRLDWLWEKSALGRWFGSFAITWARR